MIQMNIPKPYTCRHCPCYEREDKTCRVTKLSVDKTSDPPASCPMIEIPPKIIYKDEIKAKTDTLLYMELFENGDDNNTFCFPVIVKWHMNCGDNIEILDRHNEMMFYAPLSMYYLTWRLWTEKPDDELMKENLWT